MSDQKNEKEETGQEGISSVDQDKTVSEISPESETTEHKLSRLRQILYDLGSKGVGVNKELALLEGAATAYSRERELEYKPETDKTLIKAEISIMRLKQLVDWTRYDAWKLYAIVLLEVIVVGIISYLVFGDDVTIVHWFIPTIGALGAYSYCMYFSSKYVRNRTFDMYYSIEYILRVPLGAILAMVFYWTFKAGVFSMAHQTGEATNGDVVEYFPMVIAFFVGFMTDYAVAALRRMADAIMKPDKSPLEKEEEREEQC